MNTEEDIHNIFWRVDNAFYNTWNIEDKKLVKYNGNEKSIIIPKGIEKIEMNALSSKNLESIFIPDSVKVIDTFASNSNNLTELKLPPYLERIKYLAFSDNQIKSLEINSDVVIEDGAFFNNPLEILILTRNAKYARYVEWITSCLNTVKVLEIASYKEHIVFNNLCPNIELLYVDNLPGVFLSHFLKKCRLRGKKNLRRVHIKNEVSSLEKLAIQVLYPKITFQYGDFSKSPEKPVEKDNIPKNNMDVELQERIDKIHQMSALLEEKERSVIENNIAGLLNDYKNAVQKLKPKFGANEQITITFEATDAKTLRKSLLKNLDGIIFNLSSTDHLKKLIEDIKHYKELIHTQIENAPKEINSIEDKICFILYVKEKLGNHNLEKQLIEILDIFQKRVSKEIIQIIVEEKSNLSLESDVETEFKPKIQELYTEAKNYQMKVETYQELLDSLECKNNTELAIDIRTALEIISIFYNSMQNKWNERLQRVIAKYKNKINDIIFNESIETVESPSNIELEIRTDLQPLLKEIQNLSPKAVCFNMLKTEIEEGLNYFTQEENKELKNNAILDILKEIKGLLENEYIEPEIQIKVRNMVSTCLQKWLNELANNDYKILKEIPINEATEGISENIRLELLLLKELLTIKMQMEEYIQNNEDYQKSNSVAVELEENFSLELKQCSGCHRNLINDEN